MKWTASPVNTARAGSWMSTRSHRTTGVPRRGRWSGLVAEGRFNTFGYSTQGACKLTCRSRSDTAHSADWTHVVRAQAERA